MNTTKAYVKRHFYAIGHYSIFIVFDSVIFGSTLYDNSLLHHIALQKLIFFISAPKRFRSLQVSNLDSNSSSKVVVSWNEPEGFDVIDKYYIEWYRAGKHHRSGFKYLEHIPKKIKYNFTISHLESETKYKVGIYVKKPEKPEYYYYSAHITTGTNNVFFHC